MTKPYVNRSHNLTTGEAAEQLGVALRTIQLWVEAGTLPAGATPGRHRRMHVAHVQLLSQRIANRGAMPTPSEYADALRLWEGAEVVTAADPRPDTLKLAAAQLLHIKATNPKWFLQQHQQIRLGIGAPVMGVSRGELSCATDVQVHEGFLRGVAFATQWLVAFNPEVDGTPPVESNHADT